MRRPLRPLLGLLAAVLLVASPARGQHREVRSEQPFFQCRMPLPGPSDGAGAGAAHWAPPAAPILARGSGQQAADFEVTYEGFSDEARAAFQAAVDVWAQHVTSPVPIRIRAQCTDLGGNLLGSAGPYLISGFQGAPVSATWFPYPLADAIAGRDLDATRPDIEARFNSGYENWYLGTDGGGPPGQVELFTVVLHELGHGLGFIGSATVEGGQGDLGLTGNTGAEYPFLFDRFTEDDEGRALLDYPQPSAALADVLTSAVFFGGSAVEATYGQPAPLYAPGSWNEGSSYSHFDEATFPPDIPDGLMTPRIAPGERKTSPGPLLCAALDDLGWPLAEACTALIAGGSAQPPPPVLASPASASRGRVGSCAGSTTSPPPEEAYVLEIEGENPFSGQTSLSLSVRDGQRVQAWLFDAAGRRLATLLDETFSDGESLPLFVDGTDLPSGVYFVRVVGEAFEDTVTLTSIR